MRRTENPKRERWSFFGPLIGVEIEGDVLVFVQVDALALLALSDDVVLTLWQSDADLAGTVSVAAEDLVFGLLVNNRNGDVVQSVTLRGDINSE
ncbi:hypothetical protein C447_13432 [Halococcus hamelinensis 100A6]|uniref:Uncharacterized protein n=1 Tax=Halococcus hamelinensis 100A6 TaxID=1132509 RepID=M0LXP1_9EURY|nr:hypothetical protein C447_13432 [Halococcus hamelinensis 100A6]